jgi:hypothetical protein
VTLPEDVAQALGIELSNYITFDKLVTSLTCPSCQPSKLRKFMNRERAEDAFRNAHSKELFKKNSLFSFYFSEGWIEFSLEFDDQSRLRRLYLHHKSIQQERGIEIPLQSLYEMPITAQAKTYSLHEKSHIH